MNGLLLINKPEGMTSFDVVRRVKRAASTKKVGHAGTLDPDATGLLVVAVGQGTRLLRYLEGSTKVYEFDVLFGAQTTTDDHTGEVVATSDVRPTSAAVEQALEKFVGTIVQVPPKYSAVHVHGQRAYDLARKEVDFELKGREVEISSFEFLGLSGERASFRVHCGSGTYVRSLARDLALELGTLGHTARIHRTHVQGYELSEASSLGEIETDAGSCILPMVEILRDFETRQLDDAEVVEIGHGRSIESNGCRDGERVALVRADGGLMGVGRVEDGRVFPERVVAGT
jgi:tRNA pseudouridine55 synthase